MNVLEKFSGMMCQVIRKRGAFNVGDNTNRAWRKVGVIEIHSLSCMLEPFNTYMAKQAV